MASAPLYEAATNVLRQVFALYDTFVVIAEDTTHPLHNGVTSHPYRDFSSCELEADDLRDPVVQPTLDAIERLRHVASGSAPTAENAHSVWAVWAAAYSLRENSKEMYDDIRDDDKEYTHLYYIADEVEVIMDSTEFFGAEVKDMMSEFRAWVWDEGEDYVTDLLQETVGEDRSLVKWMEQLRTETEMAQW